MNKTIVAISVEEDEQGNLIGVTNGKIDDNGSCQMEHVIIVLATMLNTAMATIEVVTQNIESSAPEYKGKLQILVIETADILKRHQHISDETRVATRWK